VSSQATRAERKSRGVPVARQASRAAGKSRGRQVARQAADFLESHRLSILLFDHKLGKYGKSNFAMFLGRASP
jgi:hypothetical protein